jgi:hypothetical protein
MFSHLVQTMEPSQDTENNDVARLLPLSGAIFNGR